MSYVHTRVFATCGGRTWNSAVVSIWCALLSLGHACMGFVRTGSGAEMVSDVGSSGATAIAATINPDTAKIAVFRAERFFNFLNEG